MCVCLSAADTRDAFFPEHRAREDLHGFRICKQHLGVDPDQAWDPPDPAGGVLSLEVNLTWVKAAAWSCAAADLRVELLNLSMSTEKRRPAAV